MGILKEFSSVRFQRELGETKRIYLDHFYNGRIDGKYSFLSATHNYPIEYYPSLKPLEEKFTQDHYSLISLDVFEQLVFSALKLFQFAKEKNIVNQRLSYFLFNAITTLDDGELKDKIFTQMLFFLQNSESFLDQLKLFKNEFRFNNERIDLIEYSTRYFDFLVKFKSELESGDDFTLDELEDLRDFFQEFLSSILYGSEQGSNIFSFKEFLKSYEVDRASFLFKLSECLDYYRLSRQEHSDRNTSLFLNRENEDSNLYRSTRRPIKKTKMRSEYYVDSYILFLLKKETIHSDLKFLSSDKSNYLKSIIRSHSFVRMDEFKKQILDIL